MYLKDFLKQYSNKKIKLYVDMDGVIVDYILGEPRDFHKKRPLYDSIKKLKKISKIPNIEMHILSATKENEGIEQKNWWLDKYAPFFKRENRVIISREANNMAETALLKSNYLKSIDRDGSVIIVIDDEPVVMRAIKGLNEDIIVLKDTALVD